MTVLGAENEFAPMRVRPSVTMTSTLEFFDDPAAFLAAAGDHLAADPVLSTRRRDGRRAATAREVAAGGRAEGAAALVGRGARRRRRGRRASAMRTAPFGPTRSFLLPMPDDAAVRSPAPCTSAARRSAASTARCRPPSVRRRDGPADGRRGRVAEHTRLFELGDLGAARRRRRAGCGRRPRTTLDLALAWFTRSTPTPTSRPAASRRPRRRGEHSPSDACWAGIDAGVDWLW